MLGVSVAEPASGQTPKPFVGNTLVYSINGQASNLYFGTNGTIFMGSIDRSSGKGVIGSTYTHRKPGCSQLNYNRYVANGIPYRIEQRTCGEYRWQDNELLLSSLTTGTLFENDGTPMATRKPLRSEMTMSLSVTSTGCTGSYTQSSTFGTASGSVAACSLRQGRGM